MQNIIKKLNKALVKISSIDLNKLSKDDVEAIKDLSLCCIYHVGAVTDVINVAKQSKTIDAPAIAGILIHAESFADQVIPSLKDFQRRNDV